MSLAICLLLSEKSIRFIYYLSLSLSLTSAVMTLVAGIILPVFVFTLVPVLLCIFIYNEAIKRRDDLFYYIVLDGMMMLPAILLFIYVISFTFVS